MTAVSRGRAIAVAAAVALLASGKPSAAEQLDLPSRPSAIALDPVATYVAEASQRFGIPAAWIRAVIQVESAGEVGVTSPAGAMGLMQVMPQTYATLRARLGLGANPYDPHDNIIAGAAFLHDMHDRYGDAGFLAAYNAGPARYDDFLAVGRPLPSETILYMARLGPMLGVDGSLPLAAAVPNVVAKPEVAPIFVALHGTGTTIMPKVNASPIVQVAAADVSVDEQTAGMFASRSSSSKVRAAADQHEPQTALTAKSSSVPAAQSKLIDAQYDSIFAQTGAGRSHQ